MIMIFTKVYSIVKDIPQGKVLTYKAIAEHIGTRDIRLVGFALHSNSSPEEVPCHRVIKSNGRVAQGYAFGGPTVQQQLLEQEGIVFNNGVVDLSRYMWKIPSYSVV